MSEIVIIRRRAEEAEAPKAASVTRRQPAEQPDIYSVSYYWRAMSAVVSFC